MKTPHLERGKGRIVYVDAKGRRADFEAVLARRQRDAVALEVRRAETRQNIWWRLNRRSCDVPNGQAARADVSDGGRAAARIVRHAEGPNFHRHRIRLAADYLARHTRQASEEIEAFLLAVFRNGRRNRRETLAEMAICERWYYKRLKLFTRLCEGAEWCGRS